MTSRRFRCPGALIAALALALALARLLTSPNILAADPLTPSGVPTPRLTSFQLPDQYGTNHSFSFPRNRPLILLVGDRRGSEEIDPWIEPLKKRWTQTADIAGLADVQGAPRFLRGRITDAIRKSRTKPLLLDFEGKVTETLALKKKTANIFVVSPDGAVLAHVAGPYPSQPESDSRLKALEAALTPR